MAVLAKKLLPFVQPSGYAILLLMIMSSACAQSGVKVTLSKRHVLPLQRYQSLIDWLRSGPVVQRIAARLEEIALCVRIVGICFSVFDSGCAVR